MKMSLASGGFSTRGFETSARAIPALLDRLLLRKVPSETCLDSELVVPDGPGSGNFQLIDRVLFANAIVAIFADNTPEARRMKSQIEEAGGTVMLVSQLDVPESWLRSYAPRLTCCIVGHDFPDAGAAADFCLRLRLISPRLVILLTASDVRYHDFSPSQLPICDVKLRRPVSRIPLLLGIQAACDNRVGRDLDCPAENTMGEPIWQQPDDQRHTGTAMN